MAGEGFWIKLLRVLGGGVTFFALWVLFPCPVVKLTETDVEWVVPETIGVCLTTFVTSFIAKRLITEAMGHEPDGPRWRRMQSVSEAPMNVCSMFSGRVAFKGIDRLW